MDRQRVSAATPSAQRNATRATPHAATKCHQRCKSTSALGCAKEHNAVKPGCCHERAHARTKWKRSAHTPSKNSVKRHSCSNRIINSLPSPVVTISKQGPKIMPDLLEYRTVGLGVCPQPSKLKPLGLSNVQAALGQLLHLLIYVAGSGAGSFAGLP